MTALNPSRPRRIVLALSLACGAMLAACAGSPATRYYTVAPVPGVPAGSPYRGPPIEVRSVQVPPAMDRLEMVRTLAPGQLAVLDFDHWAAPLGQLVRQALTEDLAERLPKDKVAIPGAGWPQGRAALTVDILSYGNLDGRASLALSWALRAPAPASGDAPAPVGATLRVEVPAGTDAASTARAWSELMGQVADRIAEQLGS